MKSITVILPAKNESGTIENVASACLRILKDHNEKNRIVIVDDGSGDDTFERAASFQKKNSAFVEVIRHEKSRGVGAAYKSALARVSTDFVTWLPTDGEISEVILFRILTKLEREKVVVTFPARSWPQRSAWRIVLSFVFQRLMNLVFLNRVRYFNGNSVYPVEFLRSIPIRSNGFFFNTEILVRVLHRFRPRYEEIPYTLVPRAYGRSKALRFRNVLDIFLNCSVLRLELLSGRQWHKKY